MSEQDQLSGKFANVNFKPSIQMQPGDPNTNPNAGLMQSIDDSLSFGKQQIAADDEATQQQTASVVDAKEMSEVGNNIIKTLNEQTTTTRDTIKLISSIEKRNAEVSTATTEKVVEGLTNLANKPREIDLSDKRNPEEKSFMEKIKDSVASSCGIAKTVLFDAGKGLIKPLASGVVKFVSTPVGAGVAAGVGVAAVGAGVAAMASNMKGGGYKLQGATEELNNAAELSAKLIDTQYEFVAAQFTLESSWGKSPSARDDHNFAGIKVSPSMQERAKKVGISVSVGRKAPGKMTKRGVDGGNYVRFKSWQDFSKYFAQTIKDMYPKTVGAKTSDEYLYGITHGGKNGKTWWMQENYSTWNAQVASVKKRMSKTGIGQAMTADVNNGMQTDKINVDDSGVNSKIANAFKEFQGWKYASAKNGTQQNRTKTGWVDCSSLVGRMIKSITNGQLNWVSDNTDSLITKGDSVGTKDIKPGDMVFWPNGSKRTGHVEMYAGGGKTVGTNDYRKLARWRGLNEGGRKSKITAVRRVKKVYNIING